MKKNNIRYFINSYDGSVLFIIDDPKLFGVRDIIELVREDERVNGASYREISYNELPEKYKNSIRR